MKRFNMFGQTVQKNQNWIVMHFTHGGNKAFKNVIDIKTLKTENLQLKKIRIIVL